MKGAKLLAMFLLLSAAVAVAFTQRQTVGAEKIGVRFGPMGGMIQVAAGDRVVVLPGIQRLVEFPAGAVQFVMAGRGAVVAPVAGTEKKISCQLRYQITDAVAMVRRYGDTAPQAAVERDIRGQTTRLLVEALGRAPMALDEVAQRLVLVAAIHHELTTLLADSGVAVQSFELMGW